MDWRIHTGDALEVLRTLPDESAHCCVTSPPYWGLRDYGHDDQLGLEGTPEKYVEKLTQILREVSRVLKNDGTLWLNMGDCYHSRCGHRNDTSRWENCPIQPTAKGTHMEVVSPNRLPQAGLKDKDLVGIPWRVAFALQADGWWLRSDIIWSKPNPMPESVTDRPTRAHDYIFLLAKNKSYFYDADAIKEPVTGGAHSRGDGVNPKALLGDDHPRNVDCRYKAPGQPENTGLRKHGIRPKQNSSFSAAVSGLVSCRNKRSVWTIQTHPFPAAHFATFPPSLIEPCILAGCPKGGTVLDPFSGAGTSGLVALRNGRQFVGIELNPEYVEMARRRIENDAPLFNRREVWR